MKRRNFTKSIFATAALLGLSPLLSYSRAKNSLKILVLGGTNFLGPAVVKAALRRGHEVTLFNRGITNPDLFSDLPLIKGDREQGPAAYAPLKEQHWDAVLDVWPQHSKLVDEATEALQNHTKHYLFVSSVAVYSDFNEPNRAETYSLVPLPEDKSKWQYAEEKAAAEVIVTERFPNSHTILRPGPIKGWRDPAYDLLYWLIKLERGESILAPGDGKDALQFIDVNDVGNFAITAIENTALGAYNCVGPTSKTLSWKSFLESAKQHLDSNSELVWSSQEQLYEQEVYAWSDLPLWAPTTDDYFMEISNAKSLAAGFTYTSLSKTIDDCLAWQKKQANQEIQFGEGEDPVGLERSRELSVIEKIKG